MIQGFSEQGIILFIFLMLKKMTEILAAIAAIV